MKISSRRGATVDRCAIVLPLAATALLPLVDHSVHATDEPACSTGLSAIMLQGDDAPGTPDQFQTFDRPNVSSTGAICFAGDTNGPTSADDVLYIDTMLMVREGDAAPGTAGATFGPFEFFETANQINARGRFVFIATLSGDAGGVDRAVYRDLEAVARAGDPVPGVPDRVYDDFGFAGITDAGAVGFLADFTGSTGDDSAIMLDDIVLYREGDVVPGIEAVIWDGNFDELQWNGRGDLLFEGNTAQPTDQDIVIFRRMQDGLNGVIEEVVAQEGQPIDAVTGPDTLDQVQQTALADNGAWALRGNLGLADADRDSIVLTEAGLIAQEGDDVPEFPGARLGNFTAIDINSNGAVVYLANIEGDVPPDVDEGIFVNGCLIITDGMPAPGLPEGTMLTDLGFEDVYVNDDGLVVFAASYGGAVSGDGLFRVELPTFCLEDVDGSGVVDFADLELVRARWGPCEGCVEDLDGSGIVDFEDLLFLLYSWGPC